MPAERVVKLELARDLAEIGKTVRNAAVVQDGADGRESAERIHIENQIEALRQDPKAISDGVGGIAVGGLDGRIQRRARDGICCRSATEPVTEEKPLQVEILARPRLVNVAAASRD